MAEYIEREAAIKNIKEHQCRNCSDIGLCENCAVLTAIKLFENIPAADVQPVVCCRDCKYNKGIKTWIDNDLTADCTNGHGYPPLDWFCADGEKGEES